MIESFFQFFLDITSGMGYVGVFILMAIESSFLPLPSEIIIPPAAYLAFKGDFNVYFVILCGTFGSLFGALVNYYLARSLGRKIVYSIVKMKFMRYLFISVEDVEKTEQYFLKNGSISTFIGRLLPVIRHLISLPAGFSKMKLIPFMFYTTLGAFIWVSILAYVGYFFGANQELIAKYYEEFSLVFKILLILVVLLFIYKKIRNRKK
ncbi:MAG: DedA family protein [Candidatus Gracilibacteria bacterium]